MKSFDGKVAAITGAGSGMGRTLALSLARRGCSLAVSDVDERGLAETVELAGKHPVRVTSKRVDVSKREQMYAWADDVIRDHGKCHLIFNNAGVSHTSTIEGLDYADFEWIMGINFWGVVYGTKAFLPHLKAAGEGHIINTSSLFGLLAIPSQATYNATKFAVRGFTEALREELELTRSPVSATCVHPGGIKTNIARSARVRQDPTGLGRSQEQMAAEFEQLLRTTPAQAAEIICRGVDAGKARILVGPDAYVFDALARVTPTHYYDVLAVLEKRLRAAR